MNGKEIVQIVEEILSKKRISKQQFYEEAGVSSATFSQWRTGLYSPSAAKMKQIEDVLGISFVDYEKAKDTEAEDILESIRSRPDLKVLLRSAKDVPPSSVYSLVAQLELEKERNKQ